ncbi:hypothetical protein niasHT_031320 [Heterodera trifolii]|uniref:AAA+ ATPase domain-containing protein n=1 Tax=Heterodera trifolii TaxID=157864 RepID=A0ABD2IGA5_9BILA
MDYPRINERELKFPIPSGIVVSGPSSSGKTQLVLRLLAHANEMFDPPPKVIVWAYGEYSSQIPELERQGVIPHAGPPSEEMLKKLPKPFLIVYDDLMGDIDAKKLADLYTKKSHHNNFSVIFLTQNLFDKAMRVPRSNAQYILLMRAPSDMLSIRNLASQMFPREHGFLMDAYKQACADPYGYLLVTLHANTDNILRLRTNIFPDDEEKIRVLDNYEYLQSLGRTTSHKKRRHLLSSAGCEELLTLVEICLNLLNGSFCLTRKQKQKLLPFANTIRRLARVRSEQSARKLILQQQPQQEGGSLFAPLLAPILLEAALEAREGVGGAKGDDDVAAQTNLGFIRQQLETVKRKRAANVSERNVLYNQQLRRYLKLRKEAKDRPLKVQLSNGAQLLNKTVETGVQVRPGPDEPKDKSVLFAGEDEEIEVRTPTQGSSRSPRTNKKAIKQQEINEKKDHLLAIIMSDPQSFGATDRGKILNPKTGREFIDSDLNWSIERLVDPRPENAPSPSGTKELIRKLAHNPLASSLLNRLFVGSGQINKIYNDPANPGGFAGASALYAAVKKKHPKLKRTEFDDFLQRNTTYTLFKPKREKFRRLRTVPTGFMTDFQALSRKNSGYRYGGNGQNPEPKHIFEKGYIPNYSDHVYTVDEARSTNPQHYLLKDYYGTKLKRKFYLPELTKVQVDENTMYRIEKKYKERMRDGKKEILVKFIGFPEKYWVTDEDFEK